MKRKLRKDGRKWGSGPKKKKKPTRKEVAAAYGVDFSNKPDTMSTLSIRRNEKGELITAPVFEQMLDAMGQLPISAQNRILKEMVDATAVERLEAFTEAKANLDQFQKNHPEKFEWQWHLK